AVPARADQLSGAPAAAAIAAVQPKIAGGGDPHDVHVTVTVEVPRRDDHDVGVPRGIHELAGFPSSASVAGVEVYIAWVWVDSQDVVGAVPVEIPRCEPRRERMPGGADLHRA